MKKLLLGLSILISLLWVFTPTVTHAATVQNTNANGITAVTIEHVPMCYEVITGDTIYGSVTYSSSFKADSPATAISKTRSDYIIYRYIRDGSSFTGETYVPPLLK